LIARTEGNPLFLEESVRTLVETRALVGERGAYRLTRDVTTIEVAPTVQAVLAARIDRLPPEDKRLLQAAAVIGKDVPFLLLRAIAEIPEEGLHHGLARLQAAEFVYETSLFPDPELTFKHALTHDVTYGSLLQDRRRALHARIVEAMEAAYFDRLTEHAERLAHHALRGERWERALLYLRQAGAKAIGRCAYRQAVAYFDDTLVVLQHLPESRETLEQAIDVRLDLRNAHMPLGEHDRMIEHVSAAETLATALGDRYRLARVLAYMSTNFFIAGDHHRAIDSAERGLAAAAGLEDFRLDTELTFRLAFVHFALGDFPRVIDLTKRNIGVLAGDRVYRAFAGPFSPQPTRAPGLRARSLKLATSWRRFRGQKKPFGSRRASITSTASSLPCGGWARSISSAAISPRLFWCWNAMFDCARWLRSSPCLRGLPRAWPSRISAPGACQRRCPFSSKRCGMATRARAFTRGRPASPVRLSVGGTGR